jgi:6-phospho-beta-glucosidase
MSRKATIIGGGSVRTPLLIHGIVQERRQIGITDLRLFDIDSERAEIMARIGREIVRRAGSELSITTSANLESAVEGASFVLSSLRVGGMRARARDEELAIRHGLAGQETTGPGGAAMALRTVPVALRHARVIQSLAPQAWLINFTNPAGLVTEALTEHTGLHVVGICDTPAELFHRIATAFGEAFEDMEFDYAGLNHLGWVRRVRLRGKDVTAPLLADDDKLRHVYSGNLFEPTLIRALGLLPSEYLFFYYRQRTALANQARAGATRGGELERMNLDLFRTLSSAHPAEALKIYTSYLQTRNSSYMKLESQAESAFDAEREAVDPFETATGYHRIAVDVMAALLSDKPRTIVINCRNNGAIPDLRDSDVVEVPCAVGKAGIVPLQAAPLDHAIRGLVVAVKEYERTLIRACLESSFQMAELALLTYPIVGQWDLARDVLHEMVNSDPEHLGYLG